MIILILNIELLKSMQKALFQTLILMINYKMNSNNNHNLGWFHQEGINYILIAQEDIH